MRDFVLNNNIKFCLKTNKNTPRIAFTLNFSINKPEKNAGEYFLMNRLLLQGTSKYTSEELATILDENAIELYTDMKYDYLRFRFVCLNENFEQALTILNDIILNSTFEEFEKERIKLKGELLAELDSAKAKVSDLFTKTIYEGHPYGNCYTTTLEKIDNVTFEDIKNSYDYILNNSEKVLTIVGDIDENNVIDTLNKYIGNIPTSKQTENTIPDVKPITQKYAEIIKQDAQQAQIIQGWHGALFGSKDYATLIVMNIMLGAGGLASRLFLELREKKGLAYTVRTSYESKEKGAVFYIYIGTEPSNVQTSVDGFKIEIDKIKTIPVSAEELESAKNNYLGKLQFLTETNAQQANLMAHYATMGKPFDYKEELINQIKAVTPDDIITCANKYFTDDFVLAVIKP